MAQKLDPRREASTLLNFSVFFALLSVFLLVMGVRQLLFTVSGPQAIATVRHCELYIGYNTLDTHCVGDWTLDGHHASGTIVGADFPDIGKTVGVSVHGGDAYTHSLLSPIVVLVLGLLLAALTVFGFRQTAAMRKKAAAALATGT